MKIPYTKFQLQMAFIQLCQREDIEKKIEDLVPTLIAESPKNKKEFNENVALENGITVEQLLNSYNYTMLCSDYLESCILGAIKKLETGLGITSVQAWSLYYFGVVDKLE